ncbi:TPA: dTMP kinase [Candidatus Woesearchaeota archaeon]|nr:Thymidylate kinase [archaeon GW2011_AR15]MBS3103406.1 dTMP kinase [Candidatus Woesearchaeota archaeon]HIH41523.1 dTMP kinase [Candidatus Woesearchaeota archaeon]
MKGIYIVLEGVVGTGKTTQAAKLHKYLKGLYPDREILLTREPGGTEISESIRKIVQGTSYKEIMAAETEAYLYAASRAQSLRAVVSPVLKKGGIIISDRSVVSSLAYQGSARKLGIKKVMEINRTAIEGFLPDLILFFELDPASGLKRTFDKDGDKFESKGVDFFREIAEGYKEISAMPEFRGSWKTIDASGSREEVFSRIKESLRKILH